MTAADGHLRVLAFGEPGGRLWGAAVDAGAPAIITGDGAGRTAAVTLGADGWTQERDGWRLTGSGVDLWVEPADEPAAPQTAGSAAPGVQDLCRVRGSVSLDGSERSVACIGVRSLLDGVEAGALGSVRSVSGWVAEDEAFTLLGVRRARTAEHKPNQLAATLFDPDGWLAVSDPRLSTTYDRAGSPARVNLELWVGIGENEYPRRAAGEAAGTGGAVDAGGGRLQVVPLNCHSRGRDGAGAYVLLSL